MIDARSTILKTVIRVGCATLFVFKIIGGVLQVVEQQNYEKCRLGEYGGVYLSNYITNMNVDIENTLNIEYELKDLCDRFGYTKGIDVEDNMVGHEQSAYQYFFSGHNRYWELTVYHKRVLAQCIEAMYQNRYKEDWHDIIDVVLMSLSSHGGHCVWRAEALVNTIYDILCKFLREHRIGYESSNDAVKDLMDRMFTALKNGMVEDARNNYLHELMNGKNDKLRLEPLYECNNMDRGLRSLLKMGKDFDDVEIPKVSRRYFSMVTAKKYLIQKSHSILDKLLESSDRDKLFQNINQEKMSFEDYCRLADKSKQEIDILRTGINNSENSDEELKEWIKGECGLKIDDIAIDIGEMCEYQYNNLKCLELTNIFGFKFIVMCFNYCYFEDVRN